MPADLLDLAQAQAPSFVVRATSQLMKRSLTDSTANSEGGSDDDVQRIHWNDDVSDTLEEQGLQAEILMYQLTYTTALANQGDHTHSCFVQRRCDDVSRRICQHNEFECEAQQRARYMFVCIQVCCSSGSTSCGSTMQ